jgi:hypothetical protein
VRDKAELLEGGAFADVEQARSETFAYIEGYYDRRTTHALIEVVKIGYVFSLIACSHSPRARTKKGWLLLRRHA